MRRKHNGVRVGISQPYVRPAPAPCGPRRRIRDAPRSACRSGAVTPRCPAFVIQVGCSAQLINEETTVPVQVTAIMIGVRDLGRAKKFYGEGLGCTIDQDYPSFVSLSLGDGSSSLALYEWDAAAADAGVSPEGSGFRGVSFHYVVPSRDAVDVVMGSAVAAWRLRREGGSSRPVGWVLRVFQRPGRPPLEGGDQRLAASARGLISMWPMSRAMPYQFSADLRFQSARWPAHTCSLRRGAPCGGLGSTFSSPHGQWTWDQGTADDGGWCRNGGDPQRAGEEDR